MKPLPPDAAGFSRRRLAELHKHAGFTAQGIHREIEAAKNPPPGRAPLPDYPSPVFKKEFFAISALLCDAGWDWIMTQPEMIDLSSRSVAQNFHTFRQDYFLDRFYPEVRNTLVQSLDTWSRAHVPAQLEPAKRRLHSLLMQRFTQSQIKHLPTGDLPQTLGEVVGAGAQVGTLVTWNLLRVAPRAFREAFGRAPNHEELARLMNNSRPLLHDLAGSHLSVFHAASAANHLSIITLDGLADPTVKVVGPLENPHLELINAPEEVSEDDREISTEVRVGCPAMHIRNAAGLDVLDRALQWSLDVLKAHRYCNSIAHPVPP